MRRSNLDCEGDPVCACGDERHSVARDDRGHAKHALHEMNVSNCFHSGKIKYGHFVFITDEVRFEKDEVNTARLDPPASLRVACCRCEEAHRSKPTTTAWTRPITPIRYIHQCSYCYIAFIYVYLTASCTGNAERDPVLIVPSTGESPTSMATLWSRGDIGDGGRESSGA